MDFKLLLDRFSFGSSRPRKLTSYVALVALPLCLIACPGPNKEAPDTAPKSTVSTENASHPTTASSSAKLTIDAERAFKHVEKQVDFGPRPAGSEQLAKTREYILDELKSYGLNVTTDEFTAS